PNTFVSWGASYLAPSPSGHDCDADPGTLYGAFDHVEEQKPKPLPPKRFSPPARLGRDEQRLAGKIFDYVNDLYRRSGGRVVFADKPSAKVPFLPRGGASREIQRLSE